MNHADLVLLLKYVLVVVCTLLALYIIQETARK